MLTLRRFLFLALLVPLAALAGCSLFSGGSSPRAARSARGGFTVRVDGPGLPAAARVAADVGAYAQGRGFVRRSAKPTPQFDPVTHEPLAPAPDRYFLNNIVLEVSRQPADHRVNVYLYGSGPNADGRLIERFYRGFSQEYAARYGGADRFSENAYADDGNGASGAGGTLGSGGPIESNSPLRSGVPPVSGAPGGAGGPAGASGPAGTGGPASQF